MKKLSIITINYNNYSGLKLTLESVFAQSFADYEYIVIDGGSDDGSANLIKQHSSQLSYWVSEPDKGIYNAMNKGIKKATGEYCLFLNSGDKLTDENILNQVFSIQITEDLVYGDTIYGNMHQSYPEKITLTYLISKSLPHQSTLIKTSLFKTTGLYNEENKIISDWEFWLKAIHLYSCSYRYLSGVVISKLESAGLSQKMEYVNRRNMETEKVLKTWMIPILKQKINNPDNFNEINEIFLKLFTIRDSKLVRLTLRFEDSRFFYHIRRAYYRLNRF